MILVYLNYTLESGYFTYFPIIIQAIHWQHDLCTLKSDGSIARMARIVLFSFYYQIGAKANNAQNGIRGEQLTRQRKHGEQKGKGPQGEGGEAGETRIEA